MFRHGSLFSGIGGFDLAAQWMGWKNIFQVEWDSYCQKVLAKNFPNVKRYGDIKEFDGTKYRGLIDIISGGFPCQPFSHAGKRKGKSDDRYLWPEMLRIIIETQVPFVVGENVAGLLSMENGKILEGILFDLENAGYQTGCFVIPSASVGQCHQRERLWVVAYSSSNDISIKNRKDDENENSRKAIDESIRRIQFPSIQSNRLDDILWTITNTNDQGLEGIEEKRNTESKRTQSYEQSSRLFCSEWEKYCGESIILRRTDGLPVEMDGFKLSRKQHIDSRIKAIGNSISPQVAYQIFKAIEEFAYIQNKT